MANSTAVAPCKIFNFAVERFRGDRLPPAAKGSAPLETRQRFRRWITTSR